MSDDTFYQIFIIYFLPLIQNIIYDLSKKGIDKLTKPSEEAIENAKLEKIIRNSVYKVSDRIDQQTKESIVLTICDSYKNSTVPDIMKIVEREFRQSGLENFDAKEIASQICLNFIKNVDRTPELRSKISYESIIEIKDSINKLLGENTNYFTSINNQLSNISEEQAQLKHNVFQIIDLLTGLSTPIASTANQSRFIKDYYKDYLNHDLFLENKMTDKKKVALKDVYIHNNYIVLDEAIDNSHIDSPDIVDFIFDFIIGGLNKPKYKSKYDHDTHFIRVLFIKGLPGCGKSSLFYYFANNKAYDPSFFCNYDFYFVKLIEVYEFLDSSLTTTNPLKDIQSYIGISTFNSDKTVLMLDGLDEVCVAKDIDISTYCNNLIDAASYHKIKIIITTRVNYINISHEDNKNVLNIQLMNLSTIQMSKWCEKYFAVHDSFIEEKACAEENIAYLINNEEKQLVDIFAVPLLFYMIVVSKIDISKMNSVGELYDAVFLELQNRNYDEAEEDWAQKPRVSKKIPKELARQIAIEISYMMYIRNVQLLRFNTKELSEAILNATSSSRSIQKQDKKTIESLFPLTFFYKESADVVEFAHKSIMEFFTAEKIYQEACAFEGDFDAFIQSFMLNPTVISNEVLNFFLYFAHKDCASTLKNVFPDLLGSFSRMVHEKRTFECKNATYNMDINIVVYKIYWFFIRKVFREKAIDICNVLDDSIIRRYIISSLSASASNTLQILADNSIPYDFSFLTLDGYNFAHCNLSRSSFDNSKILFSHFQYSDLSNASFEDVTVFESLDFRSCNMRGVKMRISSYRFSAHFYGCDLSGTLFHDFSIQSCVFASNLSMRKARFVRVTMTLEQFINLANLYVEFSHIAIVVDWRNILFRNITDLNEDIVKDILKLNVCKNATQYYRDYYYSVIDESYYWINKY